MQAGCSGYVKYQIIHKTKYTYDRPVRESFNEVRLKPLTNAYQDCQTFLLKVLPTVRLQHYQDFYSNWVSHFEIQEPHTSLIIEAQAVVVTRPPSLLDLSALPAPMSVLNDVRHLERCFDYLEPSHNITWDASTWRLAMEISDGKTDVWQVVQALMHWIHTEFTYLPLSTTAYTLMQEALERRVGVCQDFAQVMIGLCRTLHIPAMYVSGYLHTAGVSASHAWVEVYLPEVGWRGLDPTHNIQTDERYVKVAVGRDYADVPPTRGHYHGTQQRRIEVAVDILEMD